MNIFGFRPFKGKFNLGNSDDIPENQDGTLIGSIKQINTALTDKADLSAITANNNVYQASYSSGKYGFTINGTFYEIGGGGMPDLDFANPLYSFNSSHTSYTPTGECYLMGDTRATASHTVTIRNKEIFTDQYLSGVYYVRFPLTKLNSGDTVKIASGSIADSSSLTIYRTL